MSNYVSVVFCRNCGSRYVDIDEWTDDGRPVFKCRSCHVKEPVSHFTLGRGKIGNTELLAARDTIAKRGGYEK